MASKQMDVRQIPEPIISRIAFADTRLAWLWLIIRVYIGWQWVVAGYDKIVNPAWVGPLAGGALSGFLEGALKKSSGAHPDVSVWYALWLKDVVIPNAALFSHFVAYGEVLVGVAMILGLFTGIAAFFGAFMNMNYLFAGTVSINPFMFLLELFLILAWRVAGWWGLDKYVLPYLGTPWYPGDLFNVKRK
jgi:thiosulfate dehydrogenase [quinone] large subunit